MGQGQRGSNSGTLGRQRLHTLRGTCTQRSTSGRAGGRVPALEAEQQGICLQAAQPHTPGISEGVATNVSVI